MKIIAKPASFARILRLANNGLDLANWYDQATQEIAEVCQLEQWDMPSFIRLLAATSPRVAVRRNIRQALLYQASRTYFPNFPRTIRACVEHTTQTGILRGPKTEAFARALLGDRSAIVVDTWIAKAFRIHDKIGYRKDVFAHIRRTIGRVAKRLNLSPRDTQACIWGGIYRCSKANRKHSSPPRYPVREEYERFLAFGRTFPLTGLIPTN